MLPPREVLVALEVRLVPDFAIRFEKLEQDIGWSTSTLHRSVVRLVDAGLLTRDRHSTGVLSKLRDAIRICTSCSHSWMPSGSVGPVSTSWLRMNCRSASLRPIGTLGPMVDEIARVAKRLAALGVDDVVFVGGAAVGSSSRDPDVEMALSGQLTGDDVSQRRAWLILEHMRVMARLYG